MGLKRGTLFFVLRIILSRKAPSPTAPKIPRWPSRGAWRRESLLPAARLHILRLPLVTTRAGLDGLGFFATHAESLRGPLNSTGSLAPTHATTTRTFFSKRERGWDPGCPKCRRNIFLVIQLLELC